jgi:hypothetical protein
LDGVVNNFKVKGSVMDITLSEHFKKQLKVKPRELFQLGRKVKKSKVLVDAVSCDILNFRKIHNVLTDGDAKRVYTEKLLLYHRLKANVIALECKRRRVHDNYVMSLYLKERLQN